jgi:hypothetical protein
MSKLKQQDMPVEDLSDLGAPVRGAGLAGLVTGNASPAPTGEEPSSSAAGAPPAPADHPPADTPGGGATAVATARRPRTTRSTRTRTRPVSAVYVSPGVKQRFEAYRHKQKATNLQVVLEAISSKHDELAAIIAASTVSTAPVDPLFPADPSAVRYLGGGSVQIGFSPTPEQEQVIDRIGAEIGFDTRSTWIAPILNAFLPGRRDSTPNRG